MPCATPVPILLRDAAPSESQALSELCLRSKAHWGYDADFMAQCREALWLSAEQIARWSVRVATDSQGARLGVAAVQVAGDEAELERLFVEPEAMGRGVGGALLTDALSRLRAQQVRALWMLSDPDAEPFYRAHGAVRVGLHPSDAIPGRTLPWLRVAVDTRVPTLTTPRLRLRPLHDADLAALANLNADPEVTRYLAGPSSRADSDALAASVRAHWQTYGFGPWAVEPREPRGATFLGLVGLWVPTFEAPFTPCVEVLWRLARAHWGRGLATEAARAALHHAFTALKLEEMVSYTARDNGASRRVMEKLGMQRDEAGDFDHPKLPEGHPLRAHVLYRLRGSG